MLRTNTRQRRVAPIERIHEGIFLVEVILSVTVREIAGHWFATINTQRDVEEPIVLLEIRLALILVLKHL
jgi:hypothetical protein